jgi:WD40 repeat protein
VAGERLLLGMLFAMSPGFLFAQEWDVPLGEVDGSHRSAESLVFAPDGKSLFAAGYYQPKDSPPTGEVRQWRVETGELLRTFHGTAQSYSFRAGTLAVSKDGRLLAAAGWARVGRDNRYSVDIWEPSSDRPRISLSSPAGRITTLAFSPDAKRLAGVTLSGTLVVWDISQANQVLLHPVHDEGAWPVIYSPDGALLITAHEDGSVGFWDSSTGEKRGEIPSKKELDLVHSLAASADGKLLAGGWHDGDNPSVVVGCKEREGSHGDPVAFRLCLRRGFLPRWRFACLGRPRWSEALVAAQAAPSSLTSSYLAQCGGSPPNP